MNFNTYLMLMNSKGAANAGGAKGSSWMSIVMLLAMFAILYFLMIRPQKKQEKADAEMRSSIEIGDEIVTVGGIVGKVVTLKDETIIIETGTDRNKLKITKNAIYQNSTATQKVAANRQASLDAAKKAKEEKKKNKNKETASKDKGSFEE